MPVEALKKAIGAPKGVGAWRATRFAMRAIFTLLSLRTSPRLRRCVKNSRSMIPPLPVIVFFVAKLHQQIASHIFKQLLMFLSEVVCPSARLPGAEGVTLLRLDRLH